MQLPGSGLRWWCCRGASCPPSPLLVREREDGSLLDLSLPRWPIQLQETSTSAPWTALALRDPPARAADFALPPLRAPLPRRHEASLALLGTGRVVLLDPSRGFSRYDTACSPLGSSERSPSSRAAAPLPLPPRSRCASTLRLFTRTTPTYSSASRPQCASPPIFTAPLALLAGR